MRGLQVVIVLLSAVLRGVNASSRRAVDGNDLRKVSNRRQSGRLIREGEAHQGRIRDGGGDVFEDIAFWERFLGKDKLTSMPTRAPATASPSVKPTTSRPTPTPSRSPTRTPVSQPTQPPTRRPTETPSGAPQSQPTNNPTRRPTPGPTQAPQTQVPTDMPTSLPTRQPTGSPTIAPTTSQPTQNPSASPTVQPCTVELASNCTNCEGNTIIDPTCNGTPPTELIMLFTGGNCSDTSSSQEIVCFDFGPGPPTVPGEMGFIVVEFDTTIYHSAWVVVGSEYVIRDPAGGTLGAPQSIVIFSSEDTSPENVLQSLIFDGDCSQPLTLKDQIGASQLVGFTVDGTTTRAFFNATIRLDVSVPEGSPDVTIERLFTESNLGFFNLTDGAEGEPVAPGSPFADSFNVTIDLTIPGEASFLSTVVARGNAETQCAAVSFFSFPFGPIDNGLSGNSGIQVGLEESSSPGPQVGDPDADRGVNTSSPEKIYPEDVRPRTRGGTRRRRRTR